MSVDLMIQHSLKRVYMSMIPVTKSILLSLDIIQLVCYGMKGVLLIMCVLSRQGKHVLFAYKQNFFVPMTSDHEYQYVILILTMPSMEKTMYTIFIVVRETIVMDVHIFHKCFFHQSILPPITIQLFHLFGHDIVHYTIPD